MSNKVQCCWLAHHLQLIFLVFLSLWFSTEFPLSTFWFLFNRADSLLRDQEVAHLSLAYPVTQLNSTLLGHVLSFLWLNPGQGGRLRAWGSEGTWSWDVVMRGGIWQRPKMGQGNGIVAASKNYLEGTARLRFPRPTDQGLFPFWLMEKSSKQVLSDSNIPSGVSKWVPNTLHNR